MYNDLSISELFLKDYYKLHGEYGDVFLCNTGWKHNGKVLMKLSNDEIFNSILTDFLYIDKCLI